LTNSGNRSIFDLRRIFMPDSMPEIPEIKPSLMLDGDQAEPFMDYDVGHTCRISGDFKVVSKSHNENSGPSIRLEATGPVAPEGSDAEEASETPAQEDSEQEAPEDSESPDEGDAEEKMLGYKRPQKDNKPAPGASAKDLED
jgi:hypothetical protein